MFVYCLCLPLRCYTNSDTLPKNALSFNTEIKKKLRKFQYGAENFPIKMYIGSTKVALRLSKELSTNIVANFQNTQMYKGQNSRSCRGEYDLSLRLRPVKDYQT